MPSAARICVVLPVYNEADHLPELIPRLFAQAPLLPKFELWALAVDDNSPDGSWDVLRQLRLDYPRLLAIQGEKQGFGIAYQRGFAAAIEQLHPRLLVQMDADLQHDPAALPSLVERWCPGVAAVIGSRFVAGASTPSFSARRRATSRVGGWLLHHVGALPFLHDYTSGYRCLDADLVARCRFSSLAARGYAFQSSLIAQLLLSGLRVIEVPIRFGERSYGESKLTARDYREFLRNVASIRRFSLAVHAGAPALAAPRAAVRAATDRS